VVKSSPWSADSGAVPEAIVIVPPLVPPPVLAGVAPDDEPELLQAPSTITTAAVSAEPTSGLPYLFMSLLHRHQRL
jgi:hypothetical protein